MAFLLPIIGRLLPILGVLFAVWVMRTLAGPAMQAWASVLQARANTEAGK